MRLSLHGETGPNQVSLGHGHFFMSGYFWASDDAADPKWGHLNRT